MLYSIRIDSNYEQIKYVREALQKGGYPAKLSQTNDLKQFRFTTGRRKTLDLKTSESIQHITGHSPLPHTDRRIPSNRWPGSAL